MATEITSSRSIHPHKSRSRMLWIVLSLCLVTGAGGLLLSTSGCTRRQTQATAEKTTYTCPMHPAVVSDKPGKCPTCGMNLVPAEKTPTTRQG
jgi:hypothetical protein